MFIFLPGRWLIILTITTQSGCWVCSSSRSYCQSGSSLVRFKLQLRKTRRGLTAKRRFHENKAIKVRYLPTELFLQCLIFGFRCLLLFLKDRSSKCTVTVLNNVVLQLFYFLSQQPEIKCLFIGVHLLFLKILIAISFFFLFCIILKNLSSILGMRRKSWT